MKKILVGLIVLSLTGCGSKSFDDIEKETNKQNSIDSKVAYLSEIINNKEFKEVEEEKVMSLYKNAVAEKKVVDERREIESILPPRDGWNGGVANSVISYLKESFPNREIKFLNGGNTLRLTNGLFYQDVRFELENNFGYMEEYTMYFLINGKSYDSSSVAGVLESSDEFYDVYLKGNNLETATDEVYKYYFGD